MTAVRWTHDSCHAATVGGVPERDALQSLRRYTRLTLLASLPLFGFWPLMALVGENVRWERLLPLSAGVVALLAVHGRRLTRAVDAPAEVPPWRPSAVTLALSVGLMVVGYTYVDPGNELWAFLPALGIAELRFGRPPGAAWRLTALLGAGIAALAAALTAMVPEIDGDPAQSALVTLIPLVAVPFAELAALWQWRLAVELDQARRDAAELGATRERLRFAEDLHDILGHALEVVSLKSELATRLAPVDPDRAHAEMAEVQRLARGALKDVRELARGRRTTELDTELTGARSLLASAGIDCVVDAAPVDARHSELLGRVLREAVTNLLRHADTSRCWITVRPAALTVVNDGVVPGSEEQGTGLLGLSRRVTEAGGEFSAGPGERSGTFAVRVVLA